VDADSAHALIELDRALVPVEHRPFHPRTATLQGEPRQVPEQRFADALATVFGAHEQVLEIQARAAHEGRVVVEKEGEPHRLLAEAGKHALGDGFLTEERLSYQRRGRHDFVQKLLVLGQLVDQAEHHLHVGDGRRTDSHRFDRRLRGCRVH